MSERDKTAVMDAEIDSDAELEAAITVEEEPFHEVPPSSNGLSSQTPAAAAGSSTSTMPSPFKLPPNPSIPQDISIIMEMVAAQGVVGSLPPVAMTAAEKRKLVEESMRSRSKGKEKEKEIPPRSETINNLEAVMEEPTVDSDSDSSSEFESSSEDEELVKNKPMTAENHEQLKQELNTFVGVRHASEDTAARETESDSGSDSDSDVELGVSSSPGMAGMGYEYIDDSDDGMDPDDGGASGGGPIVSTHEVVVVPVQMPPMEKLPMGEKFSLAGDVVSWMREKKVEAWLEKKRAEDDDRSTEETPDVGGDSKIPKSDSVEPPRVESVADAALAREERCIEEKSDVEVPVAETSAQASYPAPPTPPPSQVEKPRPSISQPSFASSGTVVIRAMQSRPGAADEGWLEEGSVLCWEDGRVLGTVHETFGPLTSPFYTIRLPPPPFPYPSLTSLTPGTRLFYPLNPSYRSFVNMLAVRDPRFKGSDASNLYDEEIGEEEMEWSDDEAEMEAKKRRKARKGSKAPSVARGQQDTPRSKEQGQNLPHPSLPARPHFDYHADDVSDAGSLYGGDEWEGVSDVGSTASGRGRPMPAPYEVDDPAMSVETVSPRPQPGPGGGNRGAARGGGHGRGQGRERGRGRGKERGGRGGGGGQRGGRGGGGGHHQQRPNFPLPQHPNDHQTPAQQHQMNNHPFYPHQNQQQQQSPYLQQSWSPQQSQPNWAPQHPQFSAPPTYQLPFAQSGFRPPFNPMLAQGFGHQMPDHSAGFVQEQPLHPQRPQYQTLPPQHQASGYEYDPSNPRGEIQQQQEFVPAINPRFAAQYQQMMYHGHGDPAL